MANVLNDNFIQWGGGGGGGGGGGRGGGGVGCWGVCGLGGFLVRVGGGGVGRAGGGWGGCWGVVGRGVGFWVFCGFELKTLGSFTIQNKHEKERVDLWGEN